MVQNLELYDLICITMSFVVGLMVIAISVLKSYEFVKHYRETLSQRTVFMICIYTLSTVVIISCLTLILIDKLIPEMVVFHEYIIPIGTIGSSFIIALVMMAKLGTRLTDEQIKQLSH